MSREISFWYVLFHLSLLVVFIWVILKSVGIIQTPDWIKYGIPVGGVIFSFFAFYHSIIGVVFTIKDELSSVKIDVAKITVKLDHHDKDLEFIKTKLYHHDKDLEFINKDLGFIKKRVAA